MSSAKDSRNLTIGLGLARANSPPSAEAQSVDVSKRTMAGAVGSVSRSLNQFQQEMKTTRDLIAAGHAIIELDPSLVDPSILQDRLGSSAQELSILADSINVHGQQVPILVRHHSTEPNRYQIAYGHRRLAACQLLGRSVLAIVRQLDDTALLVAQGQENTARKNLSFIERALFALRLEERGIGRESIMAALSTDKTELSKLISVAASVPADIISGIGPAPKAGRPRWVRLAKGIKTEAQIKSVRDEMTTLRFVNSSSDERFMLAFAASKTSASRSSEPLSVRAGDGQNLAMTHRMGKRLNIIIDEEKNPQFGQYLVDAIPALFEQFRTSPKP